METLKIDPKVKSFSVTFSSGKEEAWIKKALGAVGYVVKPFDSDLLLFTVSKFIKRGK